MDKPTLVHCMFGPAKGWMKKSGGGIAHVYWLGDVSHPQLLHEAEAFLADHGADGITSVFVAGDVHGYIAESYSPAAQRIQFCGHGALAAAWVVLNEYERDSRQSAFKNQFLSWQALRSESPEKAIQLQYAAPVPKACIIPAFASACLGRTPIAAAEVGDATDYLILEMESAEIVATTKPDFDAISSATQRAMIVTAPVDFSTETGKEKGCVFRYFAPQYGDPEDAATGSAAVQLAAYWSPRLNAASFAAQQLSPAGACMQLAQSGAKVELAARVRYG